MIFAFCNHNLLINKHRSNPVEGRVFFENIEANLSLSLAEFSPGCFALFPDCSVSVCHCAGLSVARALHGTHAVERFTLTHTQENLVFFFRKSLICR